MHPPSIHPVCIAAVLGFKMHAPVYETNIPRQTAGINYPLDHPPSLASQVKIKSYFPVYMKHTEPAL